MSVLPFSRRKLLWAGWFFVAISGAGIFNILHTDSPSQPTKPELPEVDIAVVNHQTVIDFQTYYGRLSAIEHVEVRTQVSGTIVAVNIRDGSLVKKGDVLFVIDPRPYQAEVDRATALLAVAEARSEYVKLEFERAQRLITDNAIARRDYDEKQNATREALAQVKSASASLEAAKINLGYTRIAAPISGRVSRAEITIGNVVSAGPDSTPLTTIVSVSPIYADFDADEQTFLQYVRIAREGKKVAVKLGLVNEAGYPRTGVIQSVDNRLSPSSGTIRMRASFNNADEMLLPGLYARILMDGSKPHDALLVNDAAIGTDQAKKFVLVVDKNDRVQYREVHLGGLHGQLRVITDGLSKGERIIVNGMQRAQPDTKVRPNLIAMASAPSDEKNLESSAR